MRQIEVPILLTPFMPINQRDVYLLPFPLQSRNPVEDHLHIVLSITDANNNEGTFVSVMITSSPIFHDELSFDLSDDMFEHPLREANSHVRMHLIPLSKNNEIVQQRLNPVNRMKKRYFDEMMRQIGEMVFNFDFTPLP